MRIHPLTRRVACLLMGFMLTLTPARPVAAAAAGGPYGVGFGADELQAQTASALELASQARID
jgi:hypothetical protein